MSAVECPGCETLSGVVYRCEVCGHDLAGEGTTEGREEA